MIENNWMQRFSRLGVSLPENVNGVRSQLSKHVVP